MNARPSTRRIAVIGVLGLAVGSFLLTMGASAAPRTAQNPPLNVTIANTPLPVTGSIGIAGTVAASQSGAWSVAATQAGTWNVGLTGTPSITSADDTVLVDSYVGDPAGGGAFTEAADGDVTGYKSVRVLTNCFAGGDCANITVRIYSITSGARSYLLDQFPMQNFVATSHVYDTAGTRLAVQLMNNNAGAITNIGVAIFGRTN